MYIIIGTERKLLEANIPCSSRDRSKVSALFSLVTSTNSLCFISGSNLLSSVPRTGPERYNLCSS